MNILLRLVIRVVTLSLGVLFSLPVLLRLLYAFVKSPKAMFRRVKRTCTSFARFVLSSLGFLARTDSHCAVAVLLFVSMYSWRVLFGIRSDVAD
jgi:hypothetical protein